MGNIWIEKEKGVIKKYYGKLDAFVYEFMLTEILESFKSNVLNLDK